MNKIEGTPFIEAAQSFQNEIKGKFHTILADPPWRFFNRTGRFSPENKNAYHYPTLNLEEIMKIPVQSCTLEPAHLYLWVPNALISEGLAVMNAWGFTYKTNIVWHKVLRDGGSDRRGVGFYFRNVTELLCKALHKSSYAKKLIMQSASSILFIFNNIIRF